MYFQKYAESWEMALVGKEITDTAKLRRGLTASVGRESAQLPKS